MSITRLAPRAALLLLPLFLVSCAEKNPQAPKFVVAEGKGVRVLRAELNRERDAFLQQRGTAVAQVPAEQLAQLEDNIVERLVVSQLLESEAGSLKLGGWDEKVAAEFDKAKKSFPDEAAFKAEIAKSGMTEADIRDNIRRQLVFRAVVEAKVPEGPEPAPEAITTFYNENPKNFQQPASVKASHVLIQVPPNSTPAVKATSKKAAEDARARVVKGEPFSSVARAVSQDPGSAQQGGDLGYFQHGTMVPEFDKVAFATKVGEISPVFETPFGFHFLTVTGTKPAQTVSLEEARPRIVDFLRNRDRSRRLDDYIKQLKTAAGVTTHLAAATGPAAAPAAPAAK